MGKLWVVLLVSASLNLGSCNVTPTLPLPPPVVSVSGPSQQGLVLVEGKVLPRAFVSVFNERTEAGVITRADLEGLYQAELEAAGGDLLTVWQEVSGEVGERKQVVVFDPEPASP